jgi:DNA-binding NtrC family response regulator
MRKRKILLIDDEPHLCKLMGMNLERDGGYRVTTALSGAEGIAKAKAEVFDLVITDFRMPGVDGETVLEVLKAMRPRAPVVICSVYHDDITTIRNSVREKADAIISKPIDHRVLYRTIEEVLAATDRPA